MNRPRLQPRMGRPRDGAESSEFTQGRIAVYIGRDMKARVHNLVGYLGFTSLSHFGAYAVERVVDELEAEMKKKKTT